MNKENINEIIQWTGAVAIVSGHILNTLVEYGYEVRPWNIVAFTLGTIAFLTWAIRVRNPAQGVVNLVSMFVCALGLFRAFV
jgi:hypothetical protein